MKVPADRIKLWGGRHASGGLAENADGLENLIVEATADHLLLRLPIVDAEALEDVEGGQAIYAEIPFEALPMVFTSTRLAWSIWTYSTLYREETLTGRPTGRFMVDNCRAT